MSVINKIFRNNVTWSGGDLSLNSNIQEVYVTSDVSSGKIILPPITGTSNPFDIGGTIKFIDTGGYFKFGVNFEVTQADLSSNISVNNVDSYTLKTDASKFDVVFIPTGTYSNGDLVEWEGDWFVESFLMSSTNSITAENISDSSVTETKISNNSVTTVKLKDSSVTTDKIANGNVTNDKLDSMTAGTIKGRVTTDGSPQDLTVSQVKTLLGAGNADGLATLDENGKVPSTQLPSYVDDVVEVNELPASGETSKIYVVIPSGDIYRWSGTQFVQINDAVSSADQAAKLSTTRSISSTGDATWTVNFDGSSNVSGELLISDNAVGNDKLADMVANTIKGKIDSDGNPQDLTADQVRTLINVEDGAQVNVATNLSVTNGTTSGPVVNSSTGTNVTLPSASPTTSGVITTGTQTIAGVKTFSSTIGGSVTGNSGTATKLATARNINGVSFDGSSNITITANTTNSLIAGDGLSGSNFNGSSSVTFDVDSTVVRTTGDQNIQGLKTFEDKLTIQGSSQSEVLFNILGTQGELFSITDDLEGLLFSVNDISGIPIFEVYSDNTVKIGEFGSEAIVVEGSEVKLNNATTDDSVTTALFLNGSNQIVKRTISDGAFSSPNDGTLTLSTSGIATGSATFTANQLSDSTFTVSVPGTNIAQGIRTSTTVPITSSTGTNATLSAASTTLAGVMTADDKTKLDGIDTNANNYTHPSYDGDDIDLDTGSLSGAVVISDLDFNITTDTFGHVTDANATYSTRELTPANIGAEPDIGTKGTAFNKNFGTTSGTVAQGNDSRIVNGQTAYSWGDHSTEGYLKDISLNVLNRDGVSQFILNNNDGLKFIESGATSITFGDSDNSVTISSTDTTYSAGTGLSLTGTTFTNNDKGSSQNIFKNIAVSGQTTVVADSNNDTLTFVAGNNISITTNGDNDSITINSSFTDTTYTGSTSVILNGTSFERAALSGDVSATQNSNTLTIGNSKVTTAKIADGNVTNAKLDTMAAETIKGRVSTSGAPQDLSPDQVRTLLGAGVANGLATLDDNGLVPSSQLPSYVDDILEYNTFAEFPSTGETGKIYVDLDTNDIYRWSGSDYVQVNNAVSTSDTATKLATARTISASGDATWSVTFDGSSNVSSTLTIGNDKVTNAKLANMSSNTIKGRINSDGDPQDLTADQVRTLINVEEGAQVNVGTNIAQGTRTSTTVPITSSTGTNATLSAATTTLAGVMSGADKSKLDGIATNANNYTHPSFEDLSLDIDTGVLTGSVVISDLDFNIESTGGHVTAVNATYSTRELTPANIGAEPAIGTKGTAFNKNFGTTSGTVAQGNDSRIINGQTAYGWGDHSVEGYLKNISIPILNGEGTEQFILNNGGNLKFVGDGSTTISFNPVDNSVTISSTDTNTDTNNYVSSVGFSTSTGVLTLNRTGLSALTVDLDGRYELAGTNDNYSGWNLQTDSIDRGSIGSSEIVNFVGGENVNLNYSATNNTITINSTDTNTDTNTTYSVKASAQTNGAGIDLDAGGSGSGTDTVKVLGSGATTVTRTDASTITISSTNTLPNNATITISAGSGLSTGGSFTTNQGSDGTITLAHADTSTQGSVNNSNGNVIQDITLDGFGHITGLGSVNLDTRYILSSTKGVAGGIASLDDNGLVPPSQLPSYVDDILEYNTFGEFPETGESGKIYVDLDTNNIYRWSGSTYIQVNDAVSTADNADKLDNQHGTYYLDYNNFTNTPTIPTVNNGQLTLSTSGIATGSATFTSNQSGGSTFTVNVPGTNIAQGTRTSTTVPITSSTGTNATLSAASTTLAGVMTASDKTKLDGIATNANNYTHPSFEDLSLDIDTGVLTGAVIISDLDFNIESTGGHVTAVNATYSTRELTPGDIGAQPAGSYVTTNSVQSLHSTDALRLSGNTISLYKGDGTFESITLTDNTLSTEQVQDIVGGMVTSNTELGIAVTYDDTNGKLNFNVNDPTITLSGDVTGSATMTNLGNVTISTTVANNSHTHTYGNITGMTDGSILFGLAGKLDQNNESLFWDNTNRRLGINTNIPRVALEVNGDFAATTKSFLIDHPSKEGMKLRHGSLEGPENGVYVRGRLTNNNVIELPDYWIDLVDELSITVQLTSIGEYQELFVKEIKDNKVFVNDVKDCYYLINAERKDVDKMIVEF